MKQIAECEGNPVAEREACLNCGASLSGRFCGQCGQRKADADFFRLGSALKRAFQEVFSYDSKIFQSLWLLVRRPGWLTKAFLIGKRKTYVSPLRMFLLFSAVYFFFGYASVFNLDFLLHLDAQGKFHELIARLARRTGQEPSAFVDLLNGQFQSIIKLILPLGALVLTFVLGLLFRRPKRYLGEHLIFSLHYYCFVFLVGCVVMPLTAALDHPWLTKLATLALNALYLRYAIEQVHGMKGWRAWLKALPILIAMFAFTMFAMSAALIIAVLSLM